MTKTTKTTKTTKSITIDAKTIDHLLEVRKRAQMQFKRAEIGSSESDCCLESLCTIEQVLEIIGIEWEDEQVEEPKPEKVEKPTVTEYPTDDRMFQLQLKMTRYYDGEEIVYGQTGYNDRNYKTLQGAIRSAKKWMKKNDHPKVARIEKGKYNPMYRDYEKHYFAEDGHEFTYDEEFEIWHVDGVRIVDRVTQKVLWEA